MVNAPLGRRSPYDEKAVLEAIRLAARERGVPWVMTIQGATPSAMALPAGSPGVTAFKDAAAATALPSRP